MKKFVFRSNKYNITHQDIQRGIEDRGYVDDNVYTSTQTNPLDKWYKYATTRDDENIFASSSANISRIQIHDAVNRYFDYVSNSVYKLSADLEQTYKVGYNFNKQKIYNYVEEYLLLNPQESLQFTKDPQQFLISLPGLSIKNILVYQGGEELSNTTMPVLKTNIGEIVGHHKDGKFERGLQGPFTEHNVGGYKHRHQPLGATTDRPERFKIESDGTSITFKSPVSGASSPNYSIPYSRVSRDGFTKSVVNIKNIRITGSNLLGNFKNNYEIVSGISRRTQNLALVDRPQNFSVSRVDSPYVSGVLEYALPDRRLLDGTYNKTVFVNKFGAPGDVNSTNADYSDPESGEFSAYNTVNYRNPTPRFYLKSYLAIPSYFGGYSSGSFGITASYQKTQRNNRRVPISGTTTFRLREDNKYFSYGIPARDSGFSWINKNALTGNNPGLYVNGIDNDIQFITGSEDGIGFSPLSSSFCNISFASSSLNRNEDKVLRKFLLKTGNRFLFTTKQQLSVQNNKNIMLQRKNNYFADEIYKDGSKSPQSVYTKDSAIKDKYTNIKNVYELNGVEAETLSYPFAQDYTSVVSNYYDPEDNTIKNFYKDNRNIFYSDKSKSLFKRMLDFDRYVKANNIPLKTIKEIKHEEKIYPRSQNVFRNFARIRNTYTQKWADSLDDRLTELTNSQGGIYYLDSFYNYDTVSEGPLNYSYWPMDASTELDTVSSIYRDKSGELLQLDNVNLYSSVYGYDPGLIVPSGSYFGARFGRNWNINRPTNVVHQQAGRGPCPSSYEEFYSDIRLIGQGCSVIPEYRISPRLDEYYQRDYSIYDSRFNKLELTGSTVEDSSIAVSTSSAFIEQKASTDYVDLNTYLNKELVEYKLNTIKISAKAIKKLLPYDEFYPQIRTLKLAQQFSASYSSIFQITGTQGTFRTALAPFYAPGIAFNSIKAGVGLPYPAAKISQSSGRESAYIDITSSLGNASSYYEKLPWETILTPYKNISVFGNNKIYDIDVNMVIDSTASILTNAPHNSVYDYKASNFFAETLNFFKAGSTLSSLKSKPNTEWYFPDLTKKYTMDIVINKEKGFYTYSSLENFGQKPYAFHAPPWSYVSSANATSSAYNSDTSLSPNQATASGEAYVNLTFDPSLMFIGTQDYAIQGKYTLADIIRHSTYSYSASILDGQTRDYIINVNDIMDIFSLSGDNRSWQPKIKWECPTADLNFYNLQASLTNSTGYDRGGNFAGDSIRGVWHQYAPITDNDKGLFLSVRYRTTDSENTGSLLEAVGFDPTERIKIGKISDSKEISEAIILIPFYTDECGVEKYFDIDISMFERMYRQNIGIVSEIKKISRNYVLPPSIDFMRIRELSEVELKKEEYKNTKSPFLMFPIEFSHILSQQDLADIWQGVMPSISTKAELEFKEKEFFIGNYLKDMNFKLPDNTRFKIFKVKRRAATNYQQVIDKTLGRNYLDISYGYNWPYDYFSLIEMAEIKAELKYGQVISEDGQRAESGVFDEKVVEASALSRPEKPLVEEMTLDEIRKLAQEKADSQTIKVAVG